MSGNPRVAVTFPALRALNITKRVRDGTKRREVLCELSLSVERAEIAVIMGPSGSGKTTLLGVLGGMLLPTSGEVYLDGEPVSRLREFHRAEVRRRKVGYLFQDFELIQGMSVLENTMLPLIPDALPQREVERCAQQMLERLGVGERARNQIDGLSGGERQRVALARALVHRPSVVLLDEPTAHLDVERAARLLDDLIVIANEGAAMVIASHDPRILNDARMHTKYNLHEGRFVEL